MANPLTRASTQVGRVAVRAVDFVTEHRHGDALAMVQKANQSSPNAAPSIVAASIGRRVSMEMAMLGAISGGVAVAPGVGTAAALATAAADIGVAFGRIATMIIAIGEAYGVDMSTAELRKQHTYAVLSGAESQLTARERKAGEMKKLLGKKAVDAKSSVPTMNKVETVVAAAVGEKIVAKLAAKEMTVAFASLLPLGLGAGVGAIGNRALVTSVARTANKYFASMADSVFTTEAKTGSATTSDAHRTGLRSLSPVKKLLKKG